MGLDITAYSHLEPVGKHAEGWCEDGDHIRAFVYDAFPKSFRGVAVLGAKLAWDGDTVIDGGCYVTTEKTETYDFRAGSYGGYGAWRADLQEQFNPNREPDAPFFELIWFADDSGTIGPEAAADLLADFREHADRYAPPGLFTERSREKYQHWMRACELAADGGLICFC